MIHNCCSGGRVDYTRQVRASGSSMLSTLDGRGTDSVKGVDALPVSEEFVLTLVRCGSLGDAATIFRRLSHRTVVSWTAIISGYINGGRGQEALKMYQQMQEERVQPSRYLLLSLLRTCGSLADLEEGKRLHKDVVRHRYQSDLFVGTSLVDMYAKCGNMVEAQQVFDSLAERDVVSWNAMIAGYSQQGQGEKALQLYSEMQEQGVVPNHRTFPSLLKACASLAATEDDTAISGQQVKGTFFEKAKQIHAEVIRRGLDSDIYVGNTLVHMYAKYGNMADARQVFDSLLKRDVVSWNALIAGYAQQEEGDMALELYSKMTKEGVRPNNRTFAILLKACGSLAAMEEETLVDGKPLKVQSLLKGKEIHAEVVRWCYESNVFVQSTLVHMYVKCGDLVDARYVFDTLSQHDLVSCNAMIAGYAQQDEADMALGLYCEMLEEGVTPDSWTFASVLKACGSLALIEEETFFEGQVVKLQSLRRGKEVHAEVVRRGCQSNEIVCTALVDMYAKCGDMVNAHRVFNSLLQRDVVSWTALISGCAQQEQGEKALQLYADMQDAGVIPDQTIFLCALKALSTIGALKLCKRIHQDIIKSGVELSSCVATSLIHAYGQCSSMLDARHVFDTFPHLDVMSWNALTAGYARQGDCSMSIQCFEEMQQAGVLPNEVTFLSVLAACGHAGFVEEGIHYFRLMYRDYGITATNQHLTALVDLFGRAGLLSQAENLILNLPRQPELSMWLSLLGACRKYNAADVGRRAFQRAVSLDPKHASPYVLMSSIYAQSGMWEDAHQIELLRQQAGAWKKPGHSWIEHDKDVHMFAVDDRHNGHVCARLQSLSVQLKEGGYLPY